MKNKNLEESLDLARELVAVFAKGLFHPVGFYRMGEYMEANSPFEPDNFDKCYMRYIGLPLLALADIGKYAVYGMMVRDSLLSALS